MVNLPVITWTQSCPPGLACGVSRTRLSAVTAGSVTSTPVSPIPHDARAGTTCQILAGADPNDTWAIFIVPLDARVIYTSAFPIDACTILTVPFDACTSLAGPIDPHAI